MGAWGPAIFSSDTACDVRGTYEDMLCYGHTPEEAEAQTMKEMEMDRLHPEDDPDAWLALPRNGAAAESYPMMCAPLPWR